MLSGATGKLALRILVEFCPSGFTGARVPGAFALGFCNVKGRHNCIQITGWRRGLYEGAENPRK